MGRTKGSLNRKGKRAKSPVKPVKLMKKRGRPKIKKAVEKTLPPSNIKKSKFIGYCSRCHFIIGDRDLKSKLVFICPSCGKTGRTNTLKKEIRRQPMTKKEYLENTLNADHSDMPSYYDVDHGTLKVISN